MLILLDENLLSKKLKKLFLDVGHTVQNVEDMGWRGTKDRELLDRECLSCFYLAKGIFQICQNLLVRFRNGDYTESSVSLIFPNLPLADMIPQLV